jgi:hypothetical protein
MKLTFAITLAALLLTMSGSNGESPGEDQDRTRHLRFNRPALANNSNKPAPLGFPDPRTVDRPGFVKPDPADRPDFQNIFIRPPRPIP